MKTYCLIFTLHLLTWNLVFGEIKNGYSAEIHGTRKSLERLYSLQEEDGNLSVFQKADLSSRIQRLQSFITYYELTENLLSQFVAIAPDMYNEMDSLQDSKGRPVDVYVKFLPEVLMQGGVSGTTNLGQSADDKDAYLSEYGLHSVSIKISSVNKSLLLLAHEFGHAKYQASNLSIYKEFYSVNYQNNNFHSKEIGHNSDDPSGKMAIEFENKFRGNYLNFLKGNNEKVANPLVLLMEIRKSFAKNAFAVR